MPANPVIRGSLARNVLDSSYPYLIIGSDLLYERGHAKALSTFIDIHARQTCEVIIVDPGRGQITRFGRFMAELGYKDELLPVMDVVSEQEPTRRQVHRYIRQ